MLRLLTSFLPLVVLVSGQDGLSLGRLSELNHLVTGEVFLLSEKVLEIRGFSYDGTAPAAFFWLDTAPEPTTGGRVAPDGSPSLNCALSSVDRTLPALSNVNQRVEFPGDTTITNFLGGSLSVWCVSFAANFGHLTFPSTLPAEAMALVGPELECSAVDASDAPVDSNVEIPSFIPTPEGFNCEELNPVVNPAGNAPLQVRWRVNEEILEVELIGRLPEGEYFGFGVSGSNERTEMIGADAQIADIFGGEPRVRDFFMDQRAQCSGVSGVCRDDAAGFTDDISEVSGESDEESGITVIRYKKPIAPSDSSQTSNAGVLVDQTLSVEAGVETFIVWAIGPVSPDTGNALFHSTAFETNDKTIEFGRSVQDNCPILYDGTTTAPTSTPPAAWNIPRIPDTATEITAHIGLSGGPRGYAAITGRSPWGIAWFLNGNLIPEMVMRRGTTYTFKVNGGDNPEDDSNYHPFYLTTSDRGGYQQLSPQARMNETPLAGISISQQSDSGVFGFEATGVAPICKYEVTDSSGEAMLGPYDDWVSTLNMSCAEDEAIISEAAIVAFTPDESTPDTIYYQCVTHFDLGWKITVIDEEATIPPTNGETEDVGDLTVESLEGQLDGSSFAYVVNLADPRAGGQDTITILFEVPAEAWVAIGFSTNGAMVGSEAVIGLPDTGTVEKYFLTSQSPTGVQPVPDEQQTLVDASITQQEGSTVLQFTKILEEPGEIPIIVGPNTFIGAYGFENSLNIHRSRESFTLDLVSGGLAAVQTRKTSLWKAHGWCAALAWGVLSPLAIGAAVLRNWFKGGLWFRIHQTLNALVVLLTIVAFSLAVAAINQETPSGFDANHFHPDPFPHRTVGLVVFILAFIQAVNGVLRPHVPEEGKEKTTARGGWEIFHRVLGFSLLGLSWYQVQSGIKIYDLIEETSVDYLAVFWGVAAGLAGLIALGFIKIKFFETDNIEGVKQGSEKEQLPSKMHES